MTETNQRSACPLFMPAALAACMLALVGAFGCGGGGDDGGTGPAGGESTFAGNCNDNIDNDADTLTDAADPNCGVESAANGNCADGIDNDGDGDTDAQDAGCGGGGGNCGDVVGGQLDGTACFRDPAVQQGGCGNPFRLYVLVNVANGTVNATIDALGSGNDPSIVAQDCTDDCAGDALTFTCDVTDANGNVRTITGTLSGNNLTGTIETACGDDVGFSANPRGDAECPT